MSDRIERIRKRIAKRKKERERRAPNVIVDWSDEEKYGAPTIVTYDGKEQPPLFRIDVFLLKAVIAACLFFSVAILFRYESPKLEPLRTFVKETMEKEFQFATVAHWYEQKFGKPLAFFPERIKQQDESPAYAFPASARVLQPFEKNGQGIMVETEGTVHAVEEGVIIFAGVKEPYGKTVVVQHADGSEAWYGQLSSISVKLYDFIEVGKEIGQATKKEEQNVFYFAFKRGDQFIDPIQVISFE